MKLPLNCAAEYFKDFLSDDEATEIYRNLIEEYRLDKSRLVIEAGGVLTETDSFKILFLTERLIEMNSHPEYVHGKVYPWAGPMARLRERVEALTRKEFEIAMCLYYPDGNFFAPYHNDIQTSGAQTIIPSISLGEVREFCFKENDNDETYSINLAHGSLLLMGEYCQDRYVHSLPKNPAYQKGRINITFREIGFQ